MIKQHFVRGFERGARRDHTPKIGLKRGVCQVIFETEDSTKTVCPNFEPPTQPRGQEVAARTARRFAARKHASDERHADINLHVGLGVQVHMSAQGDLRVTFPSTENNQLRRNVNTLRRNARCVRHGQRTRTIREVMIHATN
jgi:hypothetical protein